jgi:hypothetical protein
MRRALVLISVFVAALLGTGLTSAWAGEPPMLKPEFRFHADGFLVQLKTESDSAHVVLTIYRHGLIAYYEAAAQITEDSVKAHFGHFGDLDYTFTAAAAAGKEGECAGARSNPEGTFRGSFEFTGENEFVKFEADRAHGSFEVFPSSGCGKSRALLRRKGEDEVTLAATTKGKRRVDYVLAFTLDTNKGPRLFLNGLRSEKREGMVIARSPGDHPCGRPSLGLQGWDGSAESARAFPGRRRIQAPAAWQPDLAGLAAGATARWRDAPPHR